MLLLSPLVLMLLVFLAGPVVWTVGLAFTNRSLTGDTATGWSWVGPANFVQLFASEEFWHSMLLSVEYLFWSGLVGQVVLGFILALLLQNRPGWIRALVGGVVVLAWVIPEIVSAFLWFAFLGDEGTLSVIAGLLGVPYETLLVDAPMLSINLANSWRGVAFAMLIFQAALSAIPREIYDAAEVDGATGLRRTFSITIPLIKGPILTALVLVTLATLQSFTLVFAMTGGGPGQSTMVLPMFMYQQGLAFGDLSFGAAASVLLLALGAIFSVLYVRILKVRV